MKKATRKETVLGFFKICKYTFFSIWERKQAKKLGSLFLRVWSSLFLTSEKGNKRKNFLPFFKISKYAFFDICKKE